MKKSSLINEVLKVYEDLRKADPKFSQRKFAKMLELTSAELSEFLRGKRTFSEKKSKLVLRRLYKTPLERSGAYKKVFLSGVQHEEAIILEDDAFSYIANPIYFSFLQLITVEGFRPDPDWICERLRIESSELNKIIIRLISLGLIEKCSLRGYKRTFLSVSSKDDVQSAALKSHHLNDLETIKEVILSVPIDHRDISSLTFTFDVTHMDEAKEILRRAQDEIEALGAGKPKKNVYKVSTYLYPVTTVEL